jgi:hypothetical protein
MVRLNPVGLRTNVPPSTLNSGLITELLLSIINFPLELYKKELCIG